MYVSIREGSMNGVPAQAWALCLQALLDKEDKTKSPLMQRRSPYIPKQEILPPHGWLLNLPYLLGVLPPIAALVEELNVEYPMITAQAIPADVPDSLPSPPDSLLRTIGEQLVDLDVVAASLSSNWSFKEGLIEDLPVPGPSTATHSVNTSTVFKRPNPPTVARKAPWKTFTKPNILQKRRQAQSALQDIKFLQSTHHALL